jgi:hypothetical protein
MIAALLLAGLPILFWDQGPEIAPTLRQNDITEVLVSAERIDAWKASGITVHSLTSEEWNKRTELRPPGVDRQAQVASATRSPYIIANGWQFLRGETVKYRATLPRGTAALAAAEGFAYEADLALKIDPADIESFGRMLAFLRTVKQERLPPLADVAVVDDGSAVTGEVMNLLARRNLLFRAVKAPDAHYAINIQVGSKEYPESEAANPAEFALKIRRQVTDAKRWLRIYGSETVLCRLTGDSGHVRLHLLNYRGGKIEGLRVRLQGAFPGGQGQDDQQGKFALQELLVNENATEFTIPALNLYAVVDLMK